MEIVTKVVVEAQNMLSAHNSENNTYFTIRNILVGRRRNPVVSYYQAGNLGNISDVELFIQDQEELIPDLLPTAMTQRFAQIIRGDFAANPRFDCGYFAHHLAGIPYNGLLLDQDKWDFRPFQEQEPINSGDTLLMTTTWGQITHMAIYLKNGLYVSKFGRSGGVIVTSLDQMQKGFGGSRVSRSPFKEF